MKKRIYRNIGWLLVFIWILIIFSYSLKNAQTSDNQSFFFVYIIDDILNYFNIHLDLNFLNHIVRKTAHFMEYAILGSLVMIAHNLRPLFKNTYFNLIFISIPFIDETIQSFTPGRSAQLSDCLLDSCGFIFGFICLLAFIKIKKNYRKR